MQYAAMPRMRTVLPLLLFAGLSTWSANSFGQSGQARAPGLHVRSPQSVLDDPVVRRCRLLAARRVDPKLTSIETAVENAAMMFQVTLVFDAVATCRTALAKYPTEPDVIIAQYTASEALSVTVLGAKFPDREDQALALAIEAAEKDDGGDLNRQFLGFFLGSAYQWGIGTAPNRELALKWYAVAAAAGDPISKREMDRLHQLKP